MARFLRYHHNAKIGMNRRAAPAHVEPTDMPMIALVSIAFAFVVDVGVVEALESADIVKSDTEVTSKVGWGVIGLD